jgi:hypothetical protein
MDDINCELIHSETIFAYLYTSLILGAYLLFAWGLTSYRLL